MKIDSQSPASIIDFYHGGTAASNPHTGNGKGEHGDTIELSPQARQVNSLKKLLDAIPEVRMDRVALMKQEMGQGRYRIDSDSIATKMIETHSWRSNK